MVQRLSAVPQPAQIPRIWQLLAQIQDPELPALSIVELGMIRQVTASRDGWLVQFTPSYSGCPATELLLSCIRQQLEAAGFTPLFLETVLSPAWTTDWITPTAREKLRESGIAPPAGQCCDQGGEQDAPERCPRCGSQQLQLISQFAGTACKAHYRCNHCLEPFDYFKCI